MGTTTEQDNRVLPSGVRLFDLTYDEVWIDETYESILTDVDRRAWQRYEAAKPENVEWRRRKLAEHDAREPEPESEPVLSQEEVDKDLGTTTRLDVRRTPSGRLMLCGSTTTTRALSEREHAELERRTRRRTARALAAASGERARRPRPAPMTPRQQQRPRGAGRPRAAATRSSSRSGDSGEGSSDPEPPAASASVGRSPSLAPSSRLTVREVRARIVSDLVAQHGLRATVAILDRAGWPIATRALAYRDAGVEGAA